MTVLPLGPMPRDPCMLGWIDTQLAIRSVRGWFNTTRCGIWHGMPRWVGVNDCGRRVGETHHRAFLPDLVVYEIRELHEERGWSYERIRRKVRIVSLRYIGKLCRYEVRNQFAERWKRV